MIGPNFQRYRVILVYVFVCIPEYSAVLTYPSYILFCCYKLKAGVKSLLD